MNLRLISVFVSAVLFAIIGCGGTEATDRAKRQSQRFYEAAYISWFEERDNLAAIRNLTRSVESDPSNDLAHYLLGTIRLGRGEFEEAEKHLRTALELRKNGQRNYLTQVQNSLGVLLIHTGKPEEAVIFLEAAAGEVLNREPWLAMGNLGWAYTELGEYEKAIEILRRALFDQPKFCVGIYRLGVALYLHKDYSAAEQALLQSLEVPESGCDQIQDSYYFLGMIYLRQGNDEASTKNFEKCRAISATTAVGRNCSAALGK